jgi:hypothetical protein
LCSRLIGVSDGTDSKRLLLNEPTIFQDRLNRVENMLAILQNTVKQRTDLDLFRSACDSYLGKVGFDLPNSF